MILHESGAVTFMSEHEADKESAGVGVWKDLGDGVIGIGVFSFRYGPDAASSICGLVGVTSPPGNCFLMAGGQVTPSGSKLVGNLILSIKKKGKDAPFVFPDLLPITMTPLKLSQIPGPLP